MGSSINGQLKRLPGVDVADGAFTRIRFETLMLVVLPLGAVDGILILSVTR